MLYLFASRRSLVERRANRLSPERRGETAPSFSSTTTRPLAVIRPDGVYQSQQRFGMYRWHIPDPIRFRKDLRVTIQAVGWRSEGRYLPLQADIASVAYWYQTLPTAEFPKLAGKDELEII